MFHLYYVIVFSVEIVNLKKLQKSINENEMKKNMIQLKTKGKSSGANYNLFVLI